MQHVLNAGEAMLYGSVAVLRLLQTIIVVSVIILTKYIPWVVKKKREGGSVSFTWYLPQLVSIDCRF